MRIGLPNPSGQLVSIEEVRRTDPARRGGAGPIGEAGAMPGRIVPE
jgi:hypothetical protein